MNQREDLGNNPGKLKNTKRNKTVMWREKVSGEIKRVTESTCNVNIEIFLRLEAQRIRNGISWFESKAKIHRVEAIEYFNRSKNKLNLL